MKSISYTILRLGLGATFIWIGYLVFQSPVGWGTLIAPWIVDILPFPLASIMLATAIFDLIIGLLLIVNFWTRLAAALAALHLLTIIIAVFGNQGIAARDLGLFAASLSLALKN